MLQFKGFQRVGNKWETELQWWSLKTNQPTTKWTVRYREVWKWKSPSCVWLFLTHGLYRPWNSPGQNTGVGSHSLLQGIFPTQGWTQVSHIASKFFTSWATREAKEYWVGSLSLLQGIFLTQKSNQGLLHCRQILYQLSYEGSPYVLTLSKGTVNIVSYIQKGLCRCD